MRICFPEGDDSRVLAAAREISRAAMYVPILWQRARKADPDVASARSHALQIDVREYEGANALAPYTQALEEVRAGRAEMLFAGLDIAKAEFLPLVFRVFKEEIRKTGTFLFSIAYVVWRDNQNPRFCMCDPSVVEDPTVEQLADMIIRALPVAGDLLNSQPFACVLSYVSGVSSRSHAKKQQDVIEAVIRRGEKRIARMPLQLDAALDNSVLTRKGTAIQIGGRPNLLVFPNLLSANLVYKAMEVFGQDSVRLTGAFLCGLPRGVIGLMPRASRGESLVDAVRTLSILADLQSSSHHRRDNEH